MENSPFLMNTLGRFCALKSSLWYCLIQGLSWESCSLSAKEPDWNVFVREYLPIKVVVLA